MVADGLSRRQEEEGNLLVISRAESCWTKEVRTMVQEDDYFQDLNANWEAGSLDPLLYQKKGGIFYYKGWILLNRVSSDLVLA